MSRQMLIFLGAVVVLVVAVFFLTLYNLPKAPAATPLGVIKIELNPEKAPKTVANFLQYVDDKHYDGTIFHRVMGDFMVQGGGFTPVLSEKRTRQGIVNESKNGLGNERGTVAMARTDHPNSATSQFFINVVDNRGKLDPEARPDNHGYAVFGKVIDGMDIVDRIRAVGTIAKGPAFQNLPAQDVIIKSARRDESRPEGSPPVVILEIEQSPNRRS